MKVLLDTNIILDYLLKRPQFFESARTLFKWAFDGTITAFISASAVTDIYHLVSRARNHDTALNFIKDLTHFIDVADIDKSVILKALHSKIVDFEDAVQNFTAQKSGIRYIITRNEGDFKNSELEVLAPHRFVEKFREL
ncbi:MAG: PIN domain-containing protein [Bacteroidales bacterium]|nr:PIN domain-containing protein [Bacteroidales bacterium]MCF8336744.1 PIN domain-containing protein [Bacteroidales bacterium]